MSFNITPGGKFVTNTKNKRTVFDPKTGVFSERNKVNKTSTAFNPGTGDFVHINKNGRVRTNMK